MKHLSFKNIPVQESKKTWHDKYKKEEEKSELYAMHQSGSVELEYDANKLEKEVDVALIIGIKDLKTEQE